MKTTTKKVWTTNRGRELLTWSPEEKDFTVPVLSLNRGELAELGEAIRDALSRSLPLPEAAPALTRDCCGAAAERSAP